MDNQVERNDITDEYLDECHEVVTIGGCEFYPSDILYNCDPIAYRCLTADLMSEHFVFLEDEDEC